MLGISTEKNTIRINSAGCLDRCDDGPVLVVYPEAVWYTYVDQTDLDEIIESTSPTVASWSVWTSDGHCKVFIPAPSGLLEGLVHMPDDSRAHRRGGASAADHGRHHGQQGRHHAGQDLCRAGLRRAALQLSRRGRERGEFDDGDGEEEDVLAMSHYAQQEFGDELPLLLSGFSFGGYVRRVRRSSCTRASWCWSPPRWGASPCRTCRPTR